MSNLLLRLDFVFLRHSFKTCFEIWNDYIYLVHIWYVFTRCHYENGQDREGGSTPFYRGSGHLPFRDGYDALAFHSYQLYDYYHHAVLHKNEDEFRWVQNLYFMWINWEVVLSPSSSFYSNCILFSDYDYFKWSVTTLMHGTDRKISTCKCNKCMAS